MSASTLLHTCKHIQASVTLHPPYIDPFEAYPSIIHHLIFSLVRVTEGAGAYTLTLTDRVGQVIRGNNT